jgi:Ubiquitin family/BAG domain
MDLCGLFWTPPPESPSKPMTTMRVSGLGHSLTFGLISSATVRELKQRIEQETRLPAEYQSLLARGSKLDNDDLSLAEAGIQDRTKIMLMHNNLYTQEKEGFEALTRLEEEITALASKKDTSTPVLIRELVTKICCRLDEVEILGSSTLRARRKDLLKRAESLDDFQGELK